MSFPFLPIPRMSVSALVALVLLGVLAVLAPQQLPVILYKLALVILAGVVGYWLDRNLFPYARPEPKGLLGAGPSGLVNAAIYATAQLRRALIVAAAMLAVGLGL